MFRRHITNEHIVYALDQLKREGLLTKDAQGQAYRHAVVNGLGNPYDIAISIIQMNSIGLLHGKTAQANIDAAARHHHPNALHNLLRRLSNTDWFVPSIRQDVFNAVIANAAILSSNNMCMRFDMPEDQLTLERFNHIVSIAEKNGENLFIALRDIISFYIDDDIQCPYIAIQHEPDASIRPALVAFFANRPRVFKDKQNAKSDTSIQQEAAQKDWAPVNKQKDLLISNTLFKKGIISLVDPKSCEVPEIEAKGTFAVSKDRSLLFSTNCKEILKAGRFFNLPVPTAGLRHTHRRDECYVPVVVTNDRGKIKAGLYIHPRWVGKHNFQSTAELFIRFHVETCLYGFQLKFDSNEGVRPLPKYSAEFSEGECVKEVSLHPGENSYHTMQLKELNSMAILMAHYSLKGPGEKPRARITHHLPWVDYIISSSLLWWQGHMTYQALYSLCEKMLLIKNEQEKNIGSLYDSVGLTFRFITPFDNLLNPVEDLSAKSILVQLGINEEKKSQSFFDSVERQEKTFIRNYITLLTENSFDTQQQTWWKRIIAAKEASGNPVETLADLLEIANVIAVIAAAFPHIDDPENSNACSLVSTEGRQIQVAYEKFIKSGLPLPSIMCWTSLPLFLLNGPRSRGTFYFNYLPHATSISELIKNNIVEKAAANMAAHMHNQEGEVEDYLTLTTNPPSPTFFSPNRDEETANYTTTLRKKW